MKFSVTGMSCAACSARVEKAVNNLDGVKNCSVNLLTNSMTVEGDVSSETVIKAVVAVGYGASLEGHKNKNDINVDTEKHFLKLFLSIFFVVSLMYFSMGHMVNLPLPSFFVDNFIGKAIVQLLLAGIVLVINQKFFINGFKGILKGSLNMDTLVSLGSGASFVYSVYLIFLMTLDRSYSPGLYFDSSAMILTLISVGKTLESYSKGKTTNAISSLIAMKPKKATLIRDDKEVIVDIDDVQIGDIFVVKPGESIPVDGIIVDGYSAIDESMLTGESIPVDKNEKDKISAATINLSGFLKCRATHIGEDTTLAKIIKTVSDASASKAPIAKIADKVSGIFVPLVVVLSIVTFCIWILISGDLSFAFEKSISVLVISCPCALGLATPVAIMVGNGVAAKNGILFKTAASLEESGKIEFVVLDKTGTITNGKPEVTDIFSKDNEKLLQYAYSLEAKSEHPLARAIVDKAKKSNVSKLNTLDFTAFCGQGVSCKIDGRLVCGGNKDFIKTDISQEYIDRANDFAQQGKTPLFFSVDNEFLGIIAVADTIKTDSKEAIEALKKMGIKTFMLTGDNNITASVIAKQAGIDLFQANVLPEEKEKFISELKSKGKVAMVGDGINDAPALVSADVGIAIGAGTDIAIDSADVVLMNNSILCVANSLKIGRAVLKTIKENLFWAFVYNCIGIPLAAGVFISLLGLELNPMFGAAAMSLSSFCVVINALRLNLIKFNKKEEKKMKKEIKIGGMMCGHCEARVKKILEGFPQVNEAIVSHEKGTAVIILNSDINIEEIKNAIENDGYTLE